MKKISVGAQGDSKAARSEVWSLVANANHYPKWGPWSEGGYEPEHPGPSQPGMHQWFKYGRTTSREQILDVREGTNVVYTVTGGIPVKNYRAVIELTDNAVGTHISWTADWDATLLGKLVHKKLQSVYTEIMECLVRAADAKVSA